MTNEINAPSGSFRPFGLKPMSEVQPEEIRWLWPGRIPFGKLTIVEGLPGVGKSFILCDIAARLSRGDEMPGDLPRPGKAPDRAPANVIYVTVEDEPSEVLAPRLVAARANLGRVQHMGFGDEDNAPFLRLPDDAPKLERVIREWGVALVVIDTLFNHTGSIDTHKDADVRRALVPLVRIARETGCAIVCVRHFKKAGDGTAIYKGGGSTGITGLARAQLAVGPHPDADPSESRGYVAVSKSNYGRKPPALGFRIEADNRVVWTGPEPDITADDLAGSPQPEKRTALREASEFLREFLTSGERLSSEVEAEAKGRGISTSTLDRARTRVGVVARKHGEVWMSRLPDPEVDARPSVGGDGAATAAHLENVEGLEGVEVLGGDAAALGGYGEGESVTLDGTRPATVTRAAPLRLTVETDDGERVTVLPHTIGRVSR